MQNQIINMCRVLIGPNAVVTDNQINDAIERVSLIFPNMDVAQIKTNYYPCMELEFRTFKYLKGTKEDNLGLEISKLSANLHGIFG